MNHQTIGETEKNLSPNRSNALHGTSESDAPHGTSDSDAPHGASKKPTLIIALLTILLLATTALATYFYLNPSGDISPTETPSNDVPTGTSRPTRAPSEDPTANWQTYTNEEYSFSFKYPPAFQIEEGGEGSKLVYLDTSSIEIPSAYGMAMISPFELNISQHNSIDQAAQAARALFQDGYLEEKLNEPVDGYHFSGTLAQLNTDLTKVYLQSEDQVVSIDFQPTEEFNIEIFTQILSTFQFTDSQTEPNQEEQVRETVKEHLNNPQIKIANISLLGNHSDVYVVGINEKDNPGAGTLLVGKKTGQWIVPAGDSEQYCTWIETAGINQADMAFLGPSCEFSQ